MNDAIKTEKQLLKLVDERDEAEQALSQAYYQVTGKSPEWSNVFGHKQALEEIDEVVNLLKQALKNAESKSQLATQAAWDEAIDAACNLSLAFFGSLANQHKVITTLQNKRAAALKKGKNEADKTN